VRNVWIRASPLPLSKTKNVFYKIFQKCKQFFNL
jgi:hypothetical protein